MVFDFTVHHVVGREDVIVLHVEVVAVVVFRYAALLVMAGINIDFAVEYMHCRVCHIVFRNQISHFFLHGVLCFRVFATVRV